MDEQRTSNSDTGRTEHSSKQPENGGGGSTYQPGQQPSRADQEGLGDKSGSNDQPGQNERAGGATSRPGQVEGKGGEGDRTNLSGMGGPEKSNWNQDTGRGTDGS